MADIFVGRLMSSPVETVRRETPVREAATRLLEGDIGSLVVVDDDDNAVVGILTTTDFVRITADDTAAEATVGDYMSTDVTTATANDSINDVAGTMIDNGVHHIPVVDDEAGVVGMLTTTDLTSYLATVEVPQPA